MEEDINANPIATMKHLPHPQVVKDSGGVGDEEKSFFTESDVYWVPASNPAELYEQLSKYRFREIQRHQIRWVQSY